MVNDLCSCIYFLLLRPLLNDSRVDGPQSDVAQALLHSFVMTSHGI